MPLSVRSNFPLSFSLVLAAALTACGGGGGGGTTGTSSTPTPTTPTDTGLSTTIQPTTYAAGSTELALYTELSQVRLAGGFGTLAQDPAIDVAAKNHAKYVASNYFTMVNGAYPNLGSLYLIDPSTGQMNAHVENATWPLFTGVRPKDRINAAGGPLYINAGEVMSFYSPSSTCVAAELNTVFHRSGVLNPRYQFVGFGLETTRTAAKPAGTDVCAIVFGSNRSTFTLPSNWLGVYPGVGQTNVPTMMLGEAPDPAPEITAKGSPVTVYFPSALGSVNTFTLTANGTSVPVPVKQIAYSDFPGYVSPNEVHILPKQPLAKGTVYNVSFRGSLSNGTAVARDWSFTTTVN